MGAGSGAVAGAAAGTAFGPWGTVTGAGVGAAASMFGAKKQTSASNRAVEAQTQAANHAAEVEAQSAREALDFQKAEADRLARQQETDRRANYDQWAARERRLGSIGEALGYGARGVPDYVPGVPAGPSGPPVNQPMGARAPVGAVGDYLTPRRVASPVRRRLDDPYGSVGAYVR